MTETRWQRKDLLGIAELSRGEIELVLDTATSFAEVASRPIKKVPTLRGKTVLNLFFEARRATRSSFESPRSALRRQPQLLDIGSALEKGESRVDTALNLQAMSPTSASSATPIPACRTCWPKSGCRRGYQNAGDGAHEHPTQALLDAYTIREHKKRIEGLKVAIVGDLEHSRVLRSNLLLLKKLGAEVVLAAPRTMMPVGVAAFGVPWFHSIEEVLPGADVVMMLRAAGAHGAALFPGAGSIRALALTRERRGCQEDAWSCTRAMNRSADSQQRRRRLASGDPREGHQRSGGAHGGLTSDRG